MPKPHPRYSIPQRFNEATALQLYLILGSNRSAMRVIEEWKKEAAEGEKVPSRSRIEKWIYGGGWVEKAKEYDESTALAIREATQQAVVKRTLDTLEILEDTVYNSALWANELSKKRRKQDVPLLKTLNEVVLSGIKGHEYHRDTLYAKEQADKVQDDSQEVVVERTERFTFLRNRAKQIPLLEAQVIDAD
jgi:hypothetical protein